MELNHLVAVQLAKTRMCEVFKKGNCRDPSCSFAHSRSELRAAPDLTKTAICRAFNRGKCKEANCKFAHGEQELRVTPSVYKTQLCNFFEAGKCKKGNACRHAHGEAELRPMVRTPERPSASSDSASHGLAMTPAAPTRKLSLEASIEPGSASSQEKSQQAKRSSAKARDEPASEAAGANLPMKVDLAAVQPPPVGTPPKGAFASTTPPASLAQPAPSHTPSPLRLSATPTSPTVGNFSWPSTWGPQQLTPQQLTPPQAAAGTRSTALGSPASPEPQQDVQEWLHTLGLEQYSQRFQENGYDSIQILKTIAEDPKDVDQLIQETGMKTGHAKHLRRHIAELLHRSAQQQTSDQAQSSAYDAAAGGWVTNPFLLAANIGLMPPVPPRQRLGQLDDPANPLSFINSLPARLGDVPSLSGRYSPQRTPPLDSAAENMSEEDRPHFVI